MAERWSSKALAALKGRLTRRNIIIVAVGALIVWLFIRNRTLAGDERVAQKAVASDSIPTMVTRDANIIHTDSGYPRYHATATVYMSFDNATEPFWLFPDGAQIEQFDNQRNTVATLTCDSALYYQYQQLWDCIGNVRLNNVNGDRFATNRLYYDVRSERIYSDSFMHIERSDRIIEGYGFNSNAAITDYVVHRPTMILPVSDFNMAVTDSIPATAVTQKATSTASETTTPAESGSSKPRVRSDRRPPADAPPITPIATAMPLKTRDNQHQSETSNRPNP